MATETIYEQQTWERQSWDDSMRDIDRLLAKARAFHAEVRNIKVKLMQIGPEGYERASDNTLLEMTDRVNEAWRRLDEEV